MVRVHVPVGIPRQYRYGTYSPPLRYVLTSVTVRTHLRYSPYREVLTGTAVPVPYLPS
jgi:hypothetical protein